MKRKYQPCPDVGSILCRQVKILCFRGQNQKIKTLETRAEKGRKYLSRPFLYLES